MYLSLDEIAKRVKNRMDCQQKEMAKRLNVKQATVSQALTGQKRQRKTLFRIAKELDCKVDDEPHYFFKTPSQKGGNGS